MARTPDNPVPDTSKRGIADKTVAKRSSVKTGPIPDKSVTAKKTTRSKKTTHAKKPSAKAPAVPTTIRALHTHVCGIESRLKRADTITRKNVKSVETAFTALQEKLGATANTNNYALHQRVDQLSNKLTQMVRETQNAVNADLKRALGSASIPNIETALNQAELRLNAADKARTEAIVKINRHISAIARAVDTQLKSQARQQEANLSSLRQDTQNANIALTEKLDRIEDDSASAFRSVGDRVVSLTEELKAQTAASAESLKDQLTKITIDNQAEFELQRRVLEQRIESLEKEHREAENASKRVISGLKTRIESLEYGLQDTVSNLNANTAQIKANTANRADAIAASVAETAHVQEPVYSETSHYNSEPQLEPGQDYTTSHTTVSGDAFTPPMAEPAANPYMQNINLHDATPVTAATPHSVPQVPMAPMPIMQNAINSNAEPHHPATATPGVLVEFNPATFGPQTQAHAPSHGHTGEYYTNTTEYGQNPNPYETANPYIQNAAQPTPDYPEIANMQAPQEVTPPPFQTRDTFQPMSSDDDLPYADPAYAENAEPGLNTERPGTFEEKKTKAALPINLPNLTPQNKRIAAMALGVAAVGLFATQNFISSKDAANTNLASTNGLQAVNPSSVISAPNTTVKIQTSEPIGQYKDNAAPTLSASSDQITTLQSAANAGDPIAQFQLGLSYLQSGRTDEAVRLIRAAADKNQPAAQYRLAKLYEVGEGVEKDSETAQRLTERAARNGNRIAMHDLALYFAEGRGGVDTNMETAANWFEKAAQRGVVDSQYNLGVLFESGQGLPQDLTNAYVWYSIAAGQGDQLARQRIPLLGSQLGAEMKSSADKRISDFKPAKIDEKANGIFNNLAWAPKTKPVKANQNIAQVKQVQTLLGQLGYDAGGSDGAVGPKTRSAIISFERANSLPETGRINAELVDRLSLAAGV